MPSLAALRDGAELRYLLLRLNDWVPQVRDAARRALLDRMTNDAAAAFARNFALVDRALHAPRADAAFLIDPLTRILGSAAGEAAMLAVLASGSRRSARAVVRFVLEHVPGAPRAIVAAAVTSGVLRSASG